MICPAHRRRRRSALLALLLLWCLAPQVRSAVALQIQPPRLDLGSTAPGRVAEGQVCLTNDGDKELRISAKVAGAGYAVNPAALSLAPGARSCLVVSFRGDQAGTASGALTVAVEGLLLDQEHPVPLRVEVLPAQLALTPPPGAGLDVAATTVGASGTGNVTVRNVGSVPVRLDSVYFRSGADAFRAAPTGGIALGPQEQAAIRVIFTPSQGGRHEGTLVVRSRDLKPADLELAVCGTGLAPRAVVSPVPQVGIGFGTVPMGQGQQRQLTVLNEGQGDLRLTRVESSSAAFRVESAPDSAAPVRPGERREVTITYQPEYEGRAEARLTVWCNDPQQPRIALPLVGSGQQTPADIAVLNDATIDFGSVATGKAQRGDLLLWNRGGAPYTAAIALQGPAADDFVVGLPSVLVPPGQVRRVAVEFRPQDTGPREAELQVETPAGVLPVGLSGVGRFLELRPTTLDFDRVVVGASSHLAAEVYNFGNADFTITEVVSGDPQVFAVRSQVSPGNKFVLPADGMRPLPLSVTFSPAQRGVASGLIQLRGFWDGSFESREVLLSGLGIAADLELHPAGPFSFGQVVLGQSEAQTIVAANTGDTDLRVEAHAECDEARVEPDSFALAPGESMSLRLLFCPAALGPRAAKVQLISNAARERALPLQVTGQGALANIDLERVVAILASRKTSLDTLVVGWNNTPVRLPDKTKLDLVFRVPADIRPAVVGRRFFVEWTKLDDNLDPQGSPTRHEVQIGDTAESRVLLEGMNLRLLEDGNRFVRLKVSTFNHPDAPLYSVSQIFQAGGWKWEFEAKPLVSFISVRPGRSYRNSEGSRAHGKTERLIGLPGLAFFGFHNSESGGLSGVHLTAIGNVLEALSTENSIAVSAGLALSFYKDRFMLGIGRDVYDHRSRERRQGTEDLIMTVKYWGLYK